MSAARWQDEARAFGFSEHAVATLERIEGQGGAVLRLTPDVAVLRTPDRTGRGVTRRPDGTDGESWRTESPGAIQTLCREQSARCWAAARALAQEEAAA